MAYRCDVVGDDEFRRELRALFRARDELMAEHRANEEAERVIYKTTETPPRQRTDARPAIDDVLVDGIARFVAVTPPRSWPHRTSA
jgi:hypothetical protein